MYLANLTDEQKDLFLDLSLFSMESDGIIEERELALARQYCNEMNIPYRTEKKNDTYQEVLEKLAKITDNITQKAIAVELVALMYADEDFATEEDKLFDCLQKSFGFTSHESGEIIFATRHLLLSYRLLAQIVGYDDKK